LVKHVYSDLDMSLIWTQMQVRLIHNLAQLFYIFKVLALSYLLYFSIVKVSDHIIV